MQMQTLVEVGAIGVIGLAYALVTTLTARHVTVMVSALATLAVSTAVVPGADDLDGVQKAIVLVVLVLLCVRLGVRQSGVALGAAVVLGISLLFSLLPSGSLVTAPIGIAFRAFVGYLVPWLFLLVRWRREDAQALLRAVMLLPAVALVFGVVLQALHLWEVLPTDYDGSIRLAGSTIPATLALMCVAALFAAALELILFDDARHATRWLMIDLVLLVGTETRGGILAAAVLMATLFVWSLTGLAAARPRATRRAARLPLLLVAALLAAALPVLLARSAGNSYEGSFNSSGRDQAWPFFLQLADAAPLFGRGLGFSTIATAYYQPVGVQQLTNPHNEYLHLFVDGGVVLLVGYLAVFVTMFVTVARRTEPHARLMIVGMFVAVLGYAATDNPFSTPQFSVPLVITISAVIAFCPPTAVEPLESLQAAPRPVQPTADHVRRSTGPARVAQRSARVRTPSGASRPSRPRSSLRAGSGTR